MQEPHTQKKLFQLLEDALRCQDEECRYYHEALMHTDDPSLRELLMKLERGEKEYEQLLARKLDEMRALDEIQDEINESFV